MNIEEEKAVQFELFDLRCQIDAVTLRMRADSTETQKTSVSAQFEHELLHVLHVII